MVRTPKTYPATLPQTGLSRFAAFVHLSPVGLAKFTALSQAGRAPAALKISTKCVCYDNAEIHRWLANPVSYKAGE